MALLGEEEVSLASSREVRDAVTSVEERGTLVGGELGVGAEGEGLVVAEAAMILLAKDFGRNHLQGDAPVVVVLNLPAAFLVNGLVATGYGLVADDVDLVAVGADELLQNATDDGRHAGGDDDGGDVVGQRPLEVLVEVRVEGDVLDEVVDALGEGAGDGVHHLAESVSVWLCC